MPASTTPRASAPRAAGRPGRRSPGDAPDSPVAGAEQVGHHRVGARLAVQADRRVARELGLDQHDLLAAGAAPPGRLDAEDEEAVDRPAP
jgi:hypothetical protein